MMEHNFSVFRGSDTGKVKHDRLARTLGPKEVVLDITHTSICGTDEVFLHSSQVLGHEGVGVVMERGTGVTTLQIGGRVGIGYIQRTCGACKNCLTGWDQYCLHRQRYGADDPQQGCLGSQAIWSTSVLVPIPDNYSSVHSAAIMCGGATVWTVLTRYNIQRGQRIGILGVGGMGHLAVKLSVALGYETVVFSRSNSKRGDCIAFGASEFHILSQDDEKETAGNSTRKIQPVDHLLLCSSAPGNFDMLMTLMATHGTIYPLTVCLDPVPVPLLAMIDNGIRIQGSLTASTESIRQMLEFCAEHQVYPMIELQPMCQAGIEAAFYALQQGQVRYKTVLFKEENL